VCQIHKISHIYKIFFKFGKSPKQKALSNISTDRAKQKTNTMNKHYFLRDLRRRLGQRYTDNAVFSHIKSCWSSYFWLKTKIRPVSVLVGSSFLLVTACETAQDKITRREASAKQAGGGTAGSPDGMSVFRRHCVTCHGADGKLGLSGAKDLTQSALSLEERIAQITNGKNLMIPYRDVLSAAEIKAVAEYTLGLKNKSPGE
jgi:cytochrome c6